MFEGKVPVNETALTNETVLGNETALANETRNTRLDLGKLC